MSQRPAHTMSRRRFIALSLVLDALLVFGGYVVAFLHQVQRHIAGVQLRPVPVPVAGDRRFLPGARAMCTASTAPRAPRPRGTSSASRPSRWSAPPILTAALAFFGGARTVSFARSTLLIAFFVVLTFLVAWRLLFLRFGTIRWPEQRVVIVGLGQTAVELATELSSRSKWGFRVEGLVDPNTDPDRAAARHGRRLPGPRQRRPTRRPSPPSTRSTA